MKQLLKQFLTAITSKLLTNTYAVKFKEKIKGLVNSIRIPSLMSFFLLAKKDGTVDPSGPSLEETFNNAPDPKTNWDRMGLDQEAFGGMARWAMYTLVLFIVISSVWSDIVINALNLFTEFALATFSFAPSSVLPFKVVMGTITSIVSFFAKFGALPAYIAIGYYLWKALKK